ncbi:hypothetical protein D0862_13646 [Hortaea werneckii]|uniref:Uncharacterized protein n=2 Tax=Hortaea werneckii TaxID=91943 RepID=A0A3M7EKB8_HORWE|nr:hypothetical protein D0862_13646 [Hortaea werneckii]
MMKNSKTNQMKFYTALVTLAAVASQAAAVNPTAAEGTEDLAAFQQGIGHCLTPGAPCSHAKRAAEAVADALAEAEPKKYRGGMFNFCGVPGSSCARKREAVEKIGAAAEAAFDAIEAREAAADPKKYRGGMFNFCGVPGSSCARKREAEADAEADADPKRYRGGMINFCGVPGSSCARKREAEALAEADPKKKKKQAKKPKKYYGGMVSFCGLPGSSCAKKREVVDDILSKISDVSPHAEAVECYSEGGPCTQILDAADSFQEIKAREAEAAAAPHKFRVAGPWVHGAAKQHWQAKKAGRVHARQAEEDCDAEDGACTLARRALADLEEAINAGVDSLEEI